MEAEGPPETPERLLDFLAAVQDRVGASVPGLVREFLQVGEWRLAVEWVADALADARAPMTAAECEQLLRLARLVDTEPHVAGAIARGELGKVPGDG